MAIILNGTTHQMASASFGASRPTAYTIAQWWRADVAADMAVDAAAMSVGQAAGQGDLFLTWRNSSGLPARAAVHTSGGSYPTTDTSGTTSAGVWIHRTATYASTSLQYWENGAQVGATNNVTVTASAPSSWAVFVAGISGGAAQRSPGKSCMIAYWDVQLNADELAALGKGFSPAHIRPQSLRYFVPGLRNANAVIGTTATASNLTYDDDNPRIIW